MRNFLLCICLIVRYSGANEESIDPAVKLLQQYVQINTTSGNDLREAKAFWKNLARKQNASFNVYEFVIGYPVIVIKWKGTNSSLSSIILTTHVDVVPVVDENEWEYPPFSGTITKEGYLVGRGSQDCKSSGLQYYEAMRLLKKKNVELQRDLYLVIFSDHETGKSEKGINSFLNSKEFADMNIGGGIDEGLSYTSSNILLLYQDKALFVLQVDCYGIETHGSLMPDSNHTAIGKCAKVIQSFQEYRDDQVEYMKKLRINNTSGFTSINLNRFKLAKTTSNISFIRDIYRATRSSFLIFHFVSYICYLSLLDNMKEIGILKRPVDDKCWLCTTKDETTQAQGGITDNVIPGRVSLFYYINPSTETTQSEVFNELQDRVDKICSSIKLTIIRSIEKSPKVIMDNSNPYWVAISNAAETLDLGFDPTVTFDYTTAGIFRSAGIPIFGFSPLQKSKFLMHAPDESIKIQVFLDGIQLYVKSIQNLANLCEKQVAKDTSRYLSNYDMKKNYTCVNY